MKASNSLCSDIGQKMWSLHFLALYALLTSKTTVTVATNLLDSFTSGSVTGVLLRSGQTVNQPLLVIFNHLSLRHCLCLEVEQWHPPNIWKLN